MFCITYLIVLQTTFHHTVMTYRSNFIKTNQISLKEEKYISYQGIKNL